MEHPLRWEFQTVYLLKKCMVFINKPVYSACILAKTETPFFHQVTAKVLADRMTVRETGN